MKRTTDRFFEAWSVIGLTALGASELAHGSWWSIPLLVGAALYAAASNKEQK